MLIFYGFMLLLLMHALDSEITELLFTDYYANGESLLFLRDLFGAMVLVGVGMAIFRRYLIKTAAASNRPAGSLCHHYSGGHHAFRDRTDRAQNYVPQ